MGRGGSAHLSYTAFVLLSVSSTCLADSIWSVHIDESPAPPSAQGPPFSANASRNPALIPFQVIGIVGAYIGSVLIIGSLLITFGRSARKQAQSMASEPTEMVKPLSKTFERSPISPSSARNWYSPQRLREKKSASSSIRSAGGNGVSPGVESVTSFDTTIIEADRRQRQVEMEMLYAAVMARDDARTPQAEAGSPAVATDMPPEYTRGAALQVAPPDQNYLQVRGYDTGSATPRSPVRAIYPPDGDLPYGVSSPTSPIRATYPPPWQHPDPPSAHTRALSSEEAIPAAPKTNTARTSSPKKFRKSLRNIKISGPIMSDDSTADNDRTPLAPRYYVDPGIPPEPPTAGTMRSSNWPPSTPRMAEESVNQVRDLPQAYPQRASTQAHANPPQVLTELASARRPHPIRTAGIGNGSLPLRELNRQYAQQAQTAQAATFPLSPGHWNPLSPSHAYATSAGPVKTTFLETRRDGLSGPRTGVPTPYSPYMPFTPLTPVTPHLTSRAERKQRQKDEKKLKKPIVEEDAVADEKDLWSSGY